MPPTPSDPFERFCERVRVLPNGCWEWTGNCWKESGYGRLWIGQKAHVAHRWAYENVRPGPSPQRRRRRRPIKPGLSLDHTCHTQDLSCDGRQCPHRRCVNPAHLKPMPIKANILRGRGPAAANAKKTHCKQGHSLTEDNVYLRPDGHRLCRICDRERHRHQNQTPERKAYNKRLAQGSKRKASLKAYREANRERIRAYHREHYLRNRPDSVRPRERVSPEEKRRRKNARARTRYAALRASS